MLRGISLRLHERPTRASTQNAPLNPIPLRNSSTYRERLRIATETDGISVRMQSEQRSSVRRLTWSELNDALEAWHDPEDEAKNNEVKERVRECFEHASDSLDLSGLSLSTLPAIIGHMQHIECLSIANNYFSEIPECLANLANLRLLNVSYNILTEVSDSIRRFQELQFLNVACNQLHTISEEVVRLPRIQTLIVSHNRILTFPEYIHHIENLELDDQVPPASFVDFSPLFAEQWEASFQHESRSGDFEIWMARYEEILRLAEAVAYRNAFRARIGLLLDAMVESSTLRAQCYQKAQDVIGTSHDGILFSLFEMEIKQIEERIMGRQLSDENVRQEIERAFNFYRLQELAILHAQQHVDETAMSAEDAQVDALATALFFYVSPENTLDMPLGGERLAFMRYPEMSRATDEDVRQVVTRIRHEKRELGPGFLIDFVLDKDFWIQYLESRYADFIKEHTDIFSRQMEILEERQSMMSDFDYLTKANALRREKEESEHRLYRELTKNIVSD